MLALLQCNKISSETLAYFSAILVMYEPPTRFMLILAHCRLCLRLQPQLHLRPSRRITSRTSVLLCQPASVNDVEKYGGEAVKLPNWSRAAYSANPSH